MDSKWLNQQFEKYPTKNKGDLSTILGMQPSAISKMLAGTRQIKAKEYMLMRQFFDQPIGGAVQGKRKPDILSYDLSDHASQSWGRHKNAYNVISVSDASMVPDFLPGERVLIDGTSSLHEKSGIFAIEENGNVIIRIVEQISPTKIKISSISKDASAYNVTSSKIKILGRVIAKLTWL